MIKIISVVSGKGGTGKSTFCVTLGMALVEKGHTVLLLDCDCGMRGLDIMIGISRNLVFDISDVIAGNCSADRVIYPCNYACGLSLVSAPYDVEDGINPDNLKKFIEIICNDFDYIIIDSPAGIGKGFSASVLPADLCIVVANVEPVSIRCCVNVRRKLSDIGKNNIRLVLNKFSKKDFKELGLYPDLDFVIDETGIQLIGIIPDNRKIALSVQKGSAYKKKSSALESVKRIASRIDGENVPLLIY